MDWAFQAIPHAEVSTKGELGKGEPIAFCDGKINDHARFSKLKGATLQIVFEKPIAVNRLAWVNSGWNDWAIATGLQIQLDDQKPVTVKINAERQKPMPTKKPEFAVLFPDSDQSVKTLSITITDVKTTRNHHGTFELGYLQPAPAEIDLHDVGGVPASADGLTVNVELAHDMASLQCVAQTRRFRRPATWTAELGPLPKGKHTLNITWDQFGKESYFQDPLTPLNITQFALTSADSTQVPLIGIDDWQFLKQDNIHLKAAWEQVQPLRFPADQNGWRDGIPENGFGRFGWMPNNGLLVGSLSGNQFEYTATQVSSDLRAQGTFTFTCGSANVRKWQTTKANWTGLSQQTLFEYTDEMRDELAAKAPQLIKHRRQPQVVHASILAPGFLVDSMDHTFQLSLKNQANNTVWLLANIAGKTAWQKVSAPLSLTDLAEGWLVLLWEAQPHLPLLLALKNKPTAITQTPQQVQLQFDASLDRIGIGTPAGYRPWMGQPGQTDAHTNNLIEKSRQLAGILRAYPRDSRMRFITQPDHVLVEERFGYISWSNAWHEKPTVIAPVAPLLRFAHMQGYPVTWPDATPINQAIDTKYGPYAAVPGQRVTYTLPTPDLTGTFYLASNTNDPLMKQVCEKISTYDQADTRWLDRDCLGSWWMWAPASQAFTMFSEDQRKRFTANFRSELDRNLRSHAWYLRTEPNSGAQYPASFGWIHTATGTLGDVNSGIGAALYGPYNYARISGDWQLIQDRWPIFNQAIRYFLLSHDWNNMQTGAREFSGSSAIDMDGIAFEGAVAYHQMAKNLGHEDEAAIAQLLISRLAISTTMRWLGYRWTQPDNPHPTTQIGVGLGERNGFDLMYLEHANPDHIQSELALSLAWVGQYPELFKLHLQGLGNDFWHHYQYQLLDKQLPDWRVNYKGNRNNHPANVCTNLYMRGLLGATLQTLRQELAAQEGWGANPGQHVTMENAGFFAMLQGMDCPIRLHDWGKASVIQATYNPETRKVQIQLDAPAAMTLVWSVLSQPQSASLNGLNLPLTQSDQPQQLKITAGASQIDIAY
jgi:hypothetical protein